MITLEKMTDEEFERHTLELLREELGPDGLARFLRVYRPGSGNYTRDRHKWQQGITVRQIAEEIKKRREKTV
jgi:LDH2 family malate/lactate/ureidoglycolate dehydrogenase